MKATAEKKDPRMMAGVRIERTLLDKGKAAARRERRSFAAYVANLIQRDVETFPPAR